jgi:hypothetical protein
MAFLPTGCAERIVAVFTQPEVWSVTVASLTLALDGAVEYMASAFDDLNALLILHGGSVSRFS